MTRANDIGTPPVLAVDCPVRQTLPVLVSSPHSGRHYDPDFLKDIRLDGLAIRRSEDAFVDELISGVPALGGPTVRALFPRAWIDVNREPCELDPCMFEGTLTCRVRSDSPRVRAGLGIIPRVVAGGMEIYRGRLQAGEAERRISRCYVPYHDTLARLIEGTRLLFGTVCLIDCHSMPSSGHDGDSRMPDVVLGDRFGSSCALPVALAASDVLESRGAVVRRNDPYPGGHITRRYGEPARGIHAIQIEFNRRLYLDENSLEQTDGMQPTVRLLEAAVLAISRAVLELSAPARAAE